MMQYGVSMMLQVEIKYDQSSRATAQQHLLLAFDACFQQVLLWRNFFKHHTQRSTVVWLSYLRQAQPTPTLLFRKESGQTLVSPLYEL